MRPVIFLAALAAFLLVPATSALAWGPGVHMAVGNWLLANLDCVAPAVGKLMALHPGAFLYGSLAADIFIGKGSTFRPGHSHNWSTGLSLLAGADSDRTKAYAYGYLSHLAADTVAHNHYVPAMMSALPGGGKLGHVYVEMQADALVRWDSRQAFLLFDRPQGDTDGVLLDTVRHRRWPFLLKKQMMKSHLSLCGHRRWAQSLSVADRMYSLGHKDFFRSMFTLTLDAVGDFLADPGGSRVMELDPIGSRPLGKARHMPRQGCKTCRSDVPPCSLFPLPPQLKALAPRHCQCGSGEMPLRRAS